MVGSSRRIDSSRSDCAECEVRCYWESHMSDRLRRRVSLLERLRWYTLRWLSFSLFVVAAMLLIGAMIAGPFLTFSRVFGGTGSGASTDGLARLLFVAALAAAAFASFCFRRGR